METIRILRYVHAGLHESNNKNTKKKFEAIERMVQANIPAWYLKAGETFGFLNWFVQIKPEKAGRCIEHVKLYFFGKYKDMVQFLYY